VAANNEEYLLHYINCPKFLSDCNQNLDFSGRTPIKVSNNKFHRKLFGGSRDGRTDMTKLMDASYDYANAPKNEQYGGWIYLRFQVVGKKM
jgi:hypothetical protein